jgi:hypothetical protein
MQYRSRNDVNKVVLTDSGQQTDDQIVAMIEASPVFKKKRSNNQGLISNEEKTRSRSLELVQKPITREQSREYVIKYNNGRRVPKEYMEFYLERNEKVQKSMDNARFNKSKLSKTMADFHTPNKLKKVPFFGRNFAINRSFNLKDTFGSVFP